MVEQLFIYLLFIFGLRSPYTKSDVLGDDIQQSSASSQFGSLLQQPTSAAGIQFVEEEDEHRALQKKHDVLEENRINAREAYSAKGISLKSLVSKYGASPSARRTLSEQIHAAITEENNAFSIVVRFGNSQAAAAETLHVRDITPILSTYADSNNMQKTISVQSQLVSLVAKRSETMATQIMKISEIIDIAILQAAEHRGGPNTKEFDQNIQQAFDRISEAKADVIVLSSKRYFIHPRSKSSLKSTIQSVWNTVETDLDYTYRSVKQAQRAVGAVIQLQAYILNKPVPANSLD